MVGNSLAHLLADNVSELEIYTEDDGNEPIYVRQYNTWESGGWNRTLHCWILMEIQFSWKYQQQIRLKNSAIITSGSNSNTIRIQRNIKSNKATIQFGTGSAYLGYNDTFNEFGINSNFNPDVTNTFDLGNNSYRWRNLFVSNVYENGSLLKDRYLPLSGWSF